MFPALKHSPTVCLCVCVCVCLCVCVHVVFFPLGKFGSSLILLQPAFQAAPHSVSCPVE